MIINYQYVCFLALFTSFPVFVSFTYVLLLLLSHFSRVRLCVTPQTSAREAPPSLGFSRQEHWSGLPFPLQCRKAKSESEVTQSCPTLSDPMDCSPPGSFVHGIFQARVLEWGAIACVVSYIPCFLPSFLLFSLSLHVFIYLSPTLSKYILEQSTNHRIQPLQPSQLIPISYDRLCVGRIRSEALLYCSGFQSPVSALLHSLESPFLTHWGPLATLSCLFTLAAASCQATLSPSGHQSDCSPTSH